MQPTKAGFFQLTFMIYGAVCGGAFGLEAMISGSGPGIAIVVLVVMPFLFSIPISLAVAELTAAFPVEGGNYRWSRMALGDFWGFQAAWWAWMTGMVTNSSFAVLFADYLKSWMPQMTEVQHMGAALILTWAMFALNLFGIDVVGNTSILLSVLLLLPFIAMTGIGLVGWVHNPVIPFVAPGLGFLPALGAAVVTGIWLYSGYDKLSSVAEEVENPQRIFPPALLGAATLAMLSYVLPTVAALAARGNWSEWKDAYFPELAGQMGGPSLKFLMVFGGLCSNALLLNVTQLSASRVPLALAKDGLLPSWVGALAPRWGTPVAALAIGSLVTSVIAWAYPFEQILVIYAWFQMASNLLVYANVWLMRRRFADVPRPFSVPGGTTGLVLAALPTTVIAAIAIIAPIWKDGALVHDQLYKGIVAFVSGPILYGLCRPRTPLSTTP